MGKIDWGTTAEMLIPVASTVAQAKMQSKQQANPPSYSKGGRVRKTGMAKVHKGERVLTRAQARKYSRSKKG